MTPSHHSPPQRSPLTGSTSQSSLTGLPLTGASSRFPPDQTLLTGLASLMPPHGLPQARPRGVLQTPRAGKPSRGPAWTAWPCHAQGMAASTRSAFLSLW